MHAIDPVTPWGYTNDADVICDGIVFYQTPSHGGYKVSHQLNEEIPEYMRNENGWYEEDVEWCKVVVALPDKFNDDLVKTATRTLRDWYPNEYEHFFGVELKEGESFKRDKENFRTRHYNDFVVVSAINSQQYKGFVECLVRRESDNARRVFLIPSDEYDMGKFGFVVTDPSKYTTLFQK